LFARITLLGFGIALASCLNHEGSFAQPGPADEPRDDARGVPVSVASTTGEPTSAPAPALPPSLAEDAKVSPSRKARQIGHCNDEELTSPIARFSIVHMNDLQARYSDRIAGKSRYAYVAGAIADAKQHNANTLVLDAGDDYEKGSLADLRSMGEATRQMIAVLGIDARTIGNHDFSYGEAAVVRDVTRSPHPVLSANVHRKSGEESVVGDHTAPFLPYVQIDVGCVKVGIVGLTTQNYGADDQPTREPYCGVWQQDPHYTEVLEKQVRAHRREVDVMIALTHLGLYEDASLAQSVPGVDLVVGAHTEDLVKEPRPALRPDGSVGLVMQAGHYGETLGMADMVVNKRERSVGLERYRILDVNASVPYDDAVASLAEKLEKKYTPGLHATLTVNSHEVKPGKEMADLTFDAVRSEWGADALLIGKDAFWTGLPQGPITLARLYDSVLVQREPTGTSGFTSLQIISIKGSDLLALRSAFTYGPLYELYLPADINPARTYRLVVDKRVHAFPSLVLRGDVKLPKARFGGEIIDALEGYARSRSRRGLPLR
jgi:2',3'-cyclic-nucleotide 2'-phosphodiesterase (5'-nucleotidase family)